MQEQEKKESMADAMTLEEAFIGEMEALGYDYGDELSE